MNTSELKGIKVDLGKFHRIQNNSEELKETKNSNELKIIQEN